MNRKVIIVFLNIIALTIELKAQTLSTPFIIKKYTSYDGLPHNYILNLRQDDHGYLWVGTAYGLCRFDGDKFFPFNIKNGNKNIIATAGNMLADGRMWIWPQSGPEFLFDGKKINPVPDSLHQDSYTGSFEGILYWGYGMEYLWKLKTKTGWYYNYKNKIIFVGGKSDSLVLNQDDITSDFMRIVGFSGDKLYFQTDHGLYTWDNKNVRPLFQKQILGKSIYSCYRDSKKRFWIGTRKEGIYVSKPGEENVLDYHIPLINNLISGFFEDKEGNMWIAAAEGLIKVQDIQFEKFSKDNFPFLWDINSVSKGMNEDFYVLSETYGLIRRTKDKFIYSANNLFKGQLIDALCHDKKGRIWCVSRQRRLLMYDGKDYFDLTDKMPSYTGDVALDITYDKIRNKIWITGDSLSIGDENGFTSFKASNKKVIKKPHHFISLGSGKIIVSTITNELLLIDNANNIHNLNVSGLFTPENIENFFIDSTVTFFISSVGEGLIQCQIINNDSLLILNRFNTENSLKNNFIISIAFDKKSRLWVSDFAGISVIDYKKTAVTPMVYHFGQTDGLPEFVWNGHLACDEEGNIWYSTLYSLSKFPANTMQFFYKPPPVSIENVNINLKETDWSNYSDSLSPIFRLPLHPVLKHFENTVTFSFKAASMINNGDYQYSYMLKGLNNEWSLASPNTSLTFTKLKPGAYTFFVKAKRSNSDWSEPASFTFTILQAWWQQWWFILLVVLICAGIIYFIYRVRINQLNREKQIRDQIASDLHDDLGSTLNSVKVYANVAALEKDNKQYLSKIQETIQEAISSVRDIIWVLDEKKDTIDHLVTRVNHYAAPLCIVNQSRFILEIEESIRNLVLHREEKRNLYMIIKESINNSIKYAGCKMISLKINDANKKLIIEIADDGKGYDPASSNGGHGINNILKRSSEIHYKAKIDSLYGRGTTIRLEKTRL